MDTDIGRLLIIILGHLLCLEHLAYRYGTLVICGPGWYEAISHCGEFGLLEETKDEMRANNCILEEKVER